MHQTTTTHRTATSGEQLKTSKIDFIQLRIKRIKSTSRWIGGDKIQLSQDPLNRRNITGTHKQERDQNPRSLPRGTKDLSPQ